MLHPCLLWMFTRFVPFRLSLAWSHPPSQFGKRVSTLCRKCNGTNAAGINVGTNVGTRGRSLSTDIFHAMILMPRSLKYLMFFFCVISVKQNNNVGNKNKMDF